MSHRQESGEEKSSRARLEGGSAPEAAARWLFGHLQFFLGRVTLLCIQSVETPRYSDREDTDDHAAAHFSGNHNPASAKNVLFL